MPVVGAKFINLNTTDAVGVAMEPIKVFGVIKKACKMRQERDSIEQY